MKAHKVSELTVAEYLKQEEETASKYEFHNGKIYALAGGTLNHTILCGNIYSELRTALEGKKSDCITLTSEAKLHVEKKNDSNSFVYPDAMVICDGIDQSGEDKNAVTNPVLIVEVLSKSTAGYDRGDKFHLYRKILSFKEYVLIEQAKQIVDVHYKADNSDLWRIIRYEGLDELIKLASLGIEISMRSLYKNIRLNVDPIV